MLNIFVINNERNVYSNKIEKKSIKFSQLIRPMQWMIIQYFIYPLIYCIQYFNVCQFWYSQNSCIIGFIVWFCVCDSTSIFSLCCLQHAKLQSKSSTEVCTALFCFSFPDHEIDKFLSPIIVIRQLPLLPLYQLDNFFVLGNKILVLLMWLET